METGHLTRARDLLFIDGGDWCRKGTSISLGPLMPTPNFYKPGRLDRLTVAVRGINRCENNMLTAMERLSWMQARACQDEHIKSRWYEYVSADIEYWHTNLRSSLDQIALVISELADKERQVSCKFHRLYSQSRPASKDLGQFVEKLGTEWLALLQSVTWFDQIVRVRNQLLHYGGWTLVCVHQPGGIVFQVHGGLCQRLIRLDPPLMHNLNVVYFERYAAHLMAHFVVLFEDFSAIVYRRMRMSRVLSNSAAAHHAGYRVFRFWIDSTLDAIIAANNGDAAAAVE